MILGRYFFSYKKGERKSCFGSPHILHSDFPDHPCTNFFHPSFIAECDFSRKERKNPLGKKGRNNAWFGRGETRLHFALPRSGRKAVLGPASSFPRARAEQSWFRTVFSLKDTKVLPHWVWPRDKKVGLGHSPAKSPTRECTGQADCTAKARAGVREKAAPQGRLTPIFCGGELGEKVKRGLLFSVAYPRADQPRRRACPGIPWEEATRLA